MLASPLDAGRLRRLLPSLAVGFVYVAWGGLPHYHELNRIAAERAQQATEITALQTRLQDLPQAPLDAVPEACEQPSRSLDRTSPTSLVSAENRERSYVQAFAHVLATFRSEEVECTAAMPERDPTPRSSTSQRVTLSGSFTNVLAALEAIEVELPQVTVADLVMQRFDPSRPCDWELEFHFSETVP